ncbi:hypothetical protein MP228_008716 [Amoeboaphelidium protococcarum]|nr:hypothetical protein MP228_008716 [Amoeboaphelidium protococcarum]
MKRRHLSQDQKKRSPIRNLDYLDRTEGYNNDDESDNNFNRVAPYKKKVQYAHPNKDVQRQSSDYDDEVQWAVPKNPLQRLLLNAQSCDGNNNNNLNLDSINSKTYINAATQLQQLTQPTQSTFISYLSTPRGNQGRLEQMQQLEQRLDGSGGGNRLKFDQFAFKFQRLFKTSSPAEQLQQQQQQQQHSLLYRGTKQQVEDSPRSQVCGDRQLQPAGVDRQTAVNNNNHNVINDGNIEQNFDFDFGQLDDQVIDFLAVIEKQSQQQQQQQQQQQGDQSIQSTAANEDSVVSDDHKSQDGDSKQEWDDIDQVYNGLNLDEILSQIPSLQQDTTGSSYSSASDKISNPSNDNLQDAKSRAKQILTDNNNHHPHKYQ